jgi:L-galactose dehydrogenase
MWGGTALQPTAHLRVHSATLADMQYRRLGSTSLNLSIAGFGASPFGDVYNRIDPSEATRAVHFAIDEGINYFDVSPYYGLTLAEERLGAALEGHRERVILSTKCGRYGASVFDFSGSRVRASIEESLKRLRTDHVDILLAHDVEFGDMRQIVNETIPAMREIQQQGKARYIGISGYPLSTLVETAAQVPVDAILSYCHYDLLATDLDTYLAPFAREQNIGIINASALHMGILTEQGAPAWHPAPLLVREAGRRVVEHCRQHGVDAAQVAMRFCFDYASAASTLVGMATTEQVAACLHAVRTPNDPELLQEIHTIVAPAFNFAWASGGESHG